MSNSFWSSDFRLSYFWITGFIFKIIPGQLNSAMTGKILNILEKNGRCAAYMIPNTGRWNAIDL